MSISLIPSRFDIDGRKQLRLTNVATASLEQGHCLFCGIWELSFDGGFMVYSHHHRAVEQSTVPFLSQNCRMPSLEFHYLISWSGLITLPPVLKALETGSLAHRLLRSGVIVRDLTSTPELASLPVFLPSVRRRVMP